MLAGGLAICRLPARTLLHLLLGNSALPIQRSGGPYEIGVVTPPKDCQFSREGVN